MESENKVNKWDQLYDPKKKSTIANLEAKVKKMYFDQVFENAILSAWKHDHGSILEPGCGSGTVSAMLSKRDNDVTILDLSKNAIQKAKKVFQNMSTHCKSTVGDLFHLPFQDQTFDVVFNQGVMEHFQLAGLDPSIAINEMLRVTKKDGVLIILVPAFFSPLHIVYTFLKIFGLIEKLWPFEKQEFLHKSDLYKMLKNGGGKNIKVYRIRSSLFFSILGKCERG